MCFLYYTRVIYFINILVEFQRSLSCISRQKTLGVKTTGSEGEDPRKMGPEPAKRASKQSTASQMSKSGLHRTYIHFSHGWGSQRHMNDGFGLGGFVLGLAPLLVVS